jgi:hypothetical protein
MSESLLILQNNYLLPPAPNFNILNRSRDIAQKQNAVAQKLLTINFMNL